MKTELVVITPPLARAMMARNGFNRDLRPAHVERLRASFERGEYVQTHQGIAICTDGHVGDGQHRLTAISHLPDHMGFPMLVTTGLDRDAAFPVIDAVSVPRNAADVLRMDRRLVEVGAFFCRLAGGGRASVTPTQTIPFVELTASTTQELLDFCSSCSKTWSSAPVRAAAVYNMMRGIDRDYVKLIFQAMVTADFDVLPPVAKALFRSHMTGKVRAAEAYDIFVRVVRAYDPAFGKLSKIQINDQASDIATVRAWLDFKINSKKNAAAEAAAQSTKARSHLKRVGSR